MPVADVALRIKSFNKGRDPRFLARKYADMRGDPFAFYRGTCHLFYEDWPARSPLNRAPLAWVSGDLHPENFGTYRGRDGDVYFDVNDFDEAALGRPTWDVVRCLVGTLVGCAGLGILREDAESLCRRYLYAYGVALSGEHPGTVDPADAIGMIRDLMDGLSRRPPNELVLRRTEGGKRKRRLIADGTHAAAARPDEIEHVERAFDSWRKERKRTKSFVVVDIARRIAGTGSLGILRYVLLVRAKRRWLLLDMKDEPQSAPATFARVRQPQWSSEALRVVEAQQRNQGVPPPLLAAMRDGKRSFVIKELEPIEDRVRWEKWGGKLERLERLMATMGEVTAWSHLRGASWRGADDAHSLGKFGNDRDWPIHAMTYARAYAERVAVDYARFREAYDRGYFGRAKAVE
jgi:uncharacterized protein (DUF2252 family)